MGKNCASPYGLTLLANQKVSDIAVNLSVKVSLKKGLFREVIYARISNRGWRVGARVVNGGGL